MDCSQQQQQQIHEDGEDGGQKNLLLQLAEQQAKLTDGVLALISKMDGLCKTLGKCYTCGKKRRRSTFFIPSDYIKNIIQKFLLLKKLIFYYNKKQKIVKFCIPFVV